MRFWRPGRLPGHRPCSRAFPCLRRGPMAEGASGAALALRRPSLSTPRSSGGYRPQRPAQGQPHRSRPRHPQRGRLGRHLGRGTHPTASRASSTAEATTTTGARPNPHTTGHAPRSSMRTAFAPAADSSRAGEAYDALTSCETLWSDVEPELHEAPIGLETLTNHRISNVEAERESTCRPTVLATDNGTISMAPCRTRCTPPPA